MKYAETFPAWQRDGFAICEHDHVYDEATSEVVVAGCDDEHACRRAGEAKSVLTNPQHPATRAFLQIEHERA